MGSPEAIKEEYWIIEITNPIGKKGFAIETPQGLRFAVGGFDINSKQFASKDEAGHYVVEHDLYKLGKISLLSNRDISKRYGRVAKNGIYVVVNEKGQRLFFENRTQKYYFDDRLVGCCGWEDKDHVDRFVAQRQSQFPFDTLIAKLLKDGKEL